MSNQNFEENNLDSLLDSESDADFGLPEIRDRYNHGASPDVDGNLKNWSAQDFASIYVRFRPHLERHARRYLSNPVQVEEVVQDAFLYLMTTLPELDSELGVLKFLKWKIRLLSFDVLRSAPAQRETSVPQHAEFADDGDEIGMELERAEDNAVIRLALARLNPRQREVLIASVYEEKSAEEVARQVGLSANATRQLLFRAKAAFRKALVGEADVQGKSVSQLLSLAAKKAAREAGQNAARVGALILVAAIGVGILNQPDQLNESVVISAPESNEGVTGAAPTPQPEQSLPSVSGEIEEANASSNAELPVSDDGELVLESAEPNKDSGEIEAESTSLSAPSSAPSPSVSEDNPLLLPQTFEQVLSTTATSAYFYRDSRPDIFESFDGESIQIFAGTGVSAFLDYRPEELTIFNAILQIRTESEILFAIPTSFEKKTNYNGKNFELVFMGSNFYLVREDGSVVSDSIMSGAETVATVRLSTTGEIISTSLEVSR